MVASSIYRRIWAHPEVFKGEYHGNNQYLYEYIVSASFTGEYDESQKIWWRP